MTQAKDKNKVGYASATNPCRQCMPLGASWAFKGIEGCMAVLHGSQGCATYIRRYMISHFREPIDIASSSFDETTVIFGGQDNLEKAITNVYSQYKPEVIGVATTCLSETIGDDVDRFVREMKAKNLVPCELIAAKTPSYQGTQEEGFHRTVHSIVKTLAGQSPVEGKKDETPRVNVFVPMITPADIRWLKDIIRDMGGKANLLPDYSDTLDGGMWEEFHAMPPGGTTLDDIRMMNCSKASVELGSLLPEEWRPGTWLQKDFGVPGERCALPLGIESTDLFLDTLVKILGGEIPAEVLRTRARLADAYADGHKYLYGKKVVLFGDSSTVEALYRFVSEIGMDPVLSFTGSPEGLLKDSLEKYGMPAASEKPPIIKENWDFGDAESLIEELKPDLMIGNSKGYKISRKLGIPLIRVGFPIHDRFGASRQRLLGYDGTLSMLDRIVNALLNRKQQNSPLGYTYL